MRRREMQPGTAWRNKPGVVHTVEALEDSVILEVSTPELHDVVRLDDRYGRPIEAHETTNGLSR
jgi:quercetin dioxygenase-like cupin family protein